MELTKQQVQRDLNTLPAHYKTGDVDRRMAFIQKICDSFRITDAWKTELEKPQLVLRERK